MRLEKKVWSEQMKYITKKLQKFLELSHFPEIEVY